MSGAQSRRRRMSQWQPDNFIVLETITFDQCEYMRVKRKPTPTTEYIIGRSYGQEWDLCGTKESFWNYLKRLK